MPEQTTWTIGSDPAGDLVVERPSVSWRHCRLSRNADGTYLLEDLGSTNGTYANGRQVSASTPVRRGDEITLGLTVPMPWPPVRPVPVKDEPPLARVFHVGRDPDNDLVIDSVEVSGRHARVLIGAGGLEGVVEDLGSTNGTSVGAPGNPAHRAAITPWDVIYFGPIAVLAAKFFPEDTLERQESIPELVFRGPVMVVGRDPGCDLVIDFPVVSARHAQLVRAGAAFLVEDLGSSNGTFVNGKKVERSAPANAGDLIGLGSYTLRLLDSGVHVLPGGNATIVFQGEPGEVDAPSTDPSFARPSAGPSVILGGAALGAQVGVVAGAVVFSTSGAPPLVLFGLALGAVWFGLTAALFERLLSASSRVGDDERSEARIVLDVALSLGRAAVFDLLLAAVLLAVVSARLPFEGGRLTAFAFLWLAAVVGSALGLALSRVTGRLVHGLAAAVALTVLMAFLASPNRPLPRLHPVARATAAVLPSRWAFEALLLTWAGARANDSRGDPVEPFFPATTDRTGTTACALALCALLIGAVYADVVIALSQARSEAESGSEGS